jgi:hypothetical protein
MASVPFTLAVDVGKPKNVGCPRNQRRPNEHPWLGARLGGMHPGRKEATSLLPQIRGRRSARLAYWRVNR